MAAKDGDTNPKNPVNRISITAIDNLICVVFIASSILKQKNFTFHFFENKIDVWGDFVDGRGKFIA
ncbi:MAG: hypothetical protein M0R39_09715 [Prolixibacteraceae bacterium]|jgi:hypothetical protein|nr:hypothetical protein [Prolixibacteraceae bacterium]